HEPEVARARRPLHEARLSRPLAARVGAVLRLLVATIVAAVVVVARPRPAAAVGDPTLIWKTIETKHFRVHAHHRLQPVAERVAAICESTHEKLVGPMGWAPKEVTHVVVTDDTDFANG